MSLNFLDIGTLKTLLLLLLQRPGKSSDSQSRNGERKPNNNYNCCVKPIPAPEHDQLPIWSLSGGSLLEKKQFATNDEIF